ncbi:hypothetical protein EMCRGX_G013995 [Ephydatia muelleri]
MDPAKSSHRGFVFCSVSVTSRFDPAKPSSKPVVSRLRPCEVFKQTGRMQVTTLRSLQANRSYAGSIEDGTCENYFQQPYTQLHAGYDPAKPSSKPVVCRLRPCEAFKQTGRMQVTTLRSLQANRSYAGSIEDGTCENYFQQPYTQLHAGYDPAKPSSKPVVCRLRPCEAFKQTGRMQVTTLRSLEANRSYAGSIEDGTCENYFQQPFTQLYAGYDPAKPSSKPVVCRLRPCEAFKQTGRMQVPLKMEPAKTTSSNHIRNCMQVTTLRSLQANRSYAGSIEDGTCENYFQQPYTQLHAGYDPAKPSSKPVVCRLRPCEAFKQTGRMQVTTLRSLQANRSYAGSIEDGTCENYFQQPYTQLHAGYDPAKPSSKPVVCRLRPCEAFKQTGRMQVTTLRSLEANRSYAGSIEDGTCENYFQQPFTQLYAGYDPAKPSSKPVVTTLRSLQANRSYAGSIEDGTCENYFQQPYTQLLRPCEAFKQTGRMQVTTLRSLQANRSYAGYDPAKPSSKPVVCRLRPCEAFKQTGRMQVTTLRSLQANRSYAGSIEDGTCENYFQQPFTQLYAGYDPAKPSSKQVVTTLRSLQANRSYAVSIEDGTCEDYFQKPYTQLYAGYDPAKPSSKPVVTTLRSLQANRSYAGSIEDGTCENYFQQPYTQLLRPCEAFKQTGRMQVTTLRSLQANRSYAGYDPAKPSSKPVVCRLRPCEAFKQTGRMQVTTLRSLQANRSYAGSIEDGTCENYFQQPFTQLYAGYDPAKPSSKQVVCRLRPCEAFKQTGRMQFPLKMEPVKTTSRNHIRNCMQVTTLRSLEANRSYAGSIEDGTCENYFQQPYTQLHAGYDPAKPSSKPVVCRLRPCEAFKQTGRMQVTTLRSLEANRSYAGSIEDGTCENYFQQPYTQLCNLGDLMNGEDELY